jgi:hypothetical protein
MDNVYNVILIVKFVPRTFVKNVQTIIIMILCYNLVLILSFHLILVDINAKIAHY